MRGLLAIAGWLLVCMWPLRAAEPTSAPGAPAPAVAVAQPAVQESKPEIYYLPDKQGKLVAVPGMSWEDFERARRILMELAAGQQEPAFSIQRMAIHGTARDEHADLTVHLKIRTGADGWVRVPLGFDTAALQEAEYQGPGIQFIDFEGPQAGYVWWVRSKPAEQGQPQHDLTLQMLVPVSRVGERHRLRLRAPRATVSEMRVTVPVQNAQASVSPGALLRSVVSTPRGSEVSVNEVAGDFELLWGKSSETGEETSPALEVDAVVLSRIGLRTIDTQATLTISSQPAPFDRFTLRLPPGTILSGAGADYQVVPVKGPGRAGGKAELMEIRLGDKTRGPVEVQLTAQRPLEPGSENNQWLELGGFDVLGAVRQRGILAVAALSDWQILWGESRGVRRLEQLPAALQAEDVVAGFEYFVERYSLKIQLVRRKTRVSVEPSYKVAVEPDGVRLDGKLRYTVRGPELSTLYVEVPGWQLAADRPPVEPDTLVAVDGVTLDQAGRLTIPLLRPTAGRLEIEVHLVRVLPSEADSFEIELPRPEATWTTPADLTIQPAPNVELIPRSEAIEGLVRHTPPGASAAAAYQSAPLFYRAEALPAVFAARMHLRRRELAVEVTSRLSIVDRTPQVEQTLDYTIAYEPTDQLTLLVPQSVASSDLLEVVHEDEPAMVVPVAHSAAADPAAPVAVQVLLGTSCIGHCRLTVRHPLEPVQPPTAGEARLALPLAMPAEGELRANVLAIAAPQAMRIEPAEEGWHRLSSSSGSSDMEPPVQQWVSDQSDTEVLLRVAAVAEEANGRTLVDRAWVQTWLTQSVRQDRAVFRFSSTRPTIRLLLPAGAAREKVALSLDGQALEPRRQGATALEIPLSPGAAERFHVLEVRYYLPRSRRGAGPLELELPRLDGSAAAGRVYWQLVLPANEHVISSPPGWASELTWGWCGYFWGRRPVWEQEDLESWSGAAHRMPVPAETNRYLYSTLGTPGTCRLRTASRSWIVLVASGAALVAGLILIYVPMVRRPGLLLVLAVVLLGLGVWSPATALLGAQAAVLGLVLTVLAGLLQRVMVQRRGRAMRAAPGLETTTVPWEPVEALEPPASEQPSTQTAPIGMPPSAGKTPQ